MEAARNLLFNRLLILPILSLPGPARSDLFLNELLALNVTAHADARGQYEDWIEIYNSGDAAVDLARYSMIDDWPDKTPWRIPAGHADRTTVPPRGYLLLYADGEPSAGADHLPFRLSKNGELVVLIAPDGATLVDSVSFPVQLRDVSYGRPSGRIGPWVYFPEPTPGDANGRGWETFVPPPVIEAESGLFDDGPAVSVLAARPGDLVRYTLDGSDPTASSARYEKPIEIALTTVLKARSFAEGALPSAVVARVFLVDVRHTLPILTVLTDPANLHDPDSGILTNDQPGRAWERFVELAFFEGGRLGFQVPAGLRLQGNTGPKEYRKKSFRAFFRGGYGAADLEYPLYPRDRVDQFNRLVLRSGYDDSLEPTEKSTNRGGTLLHDPLAAEMWGRIGGLTPQSRFAVLYLNAGFTGIYDLKQNIDEDFVQDHLGYDDVDLVRTRWDSTELVHGDKEKWDEMIRFFAGHSLVDDDELAAAGRLLDLDNFIDLQALVHAIHYRNWAYGVWAFREKEADGRWQWTIWDADRTFDNVDWDGFTTLFNPLNRELDSLLTKRLLDNESFRIKYINRFADLFNTTFSGPEVLSLVDSLARIIEPEIPGEIDRWGNTVEKWEENVELLRTFAAQRPRAVRRQMEEFFQLEGQVQLTVDVEGEGEVQVNTARPGEFPWSGVYFRNIPLPVRARAAPGHRFAGWSDPRLPARPAVTLTPTGDRVLKAFFTPGEEPVIAAELIAPQSVPAGRHFPFVVRLRNPDGSIEPTEQTPMQVRFSGARADTVIAIKRGAGTGVARMGESGFTLEVENEAVATASRDIALSTRPVQVQAGSLPAGEVIWDAAVDHLVSGDIAVPEDTHLILEAGAWVAVGARVNFIIDGRVSVRGTAAAPVVLTAADWPEPWGGMEFTEAEADFQYCMVLNGGGDDTRGLWHTGRQHIFFGKVNSTFHFDQCFYLNSPGKVFGTSNSVASISNSVSSFVHHGGEFLLTLLSYRDSHFMNLPNDDGLYERDIDTDGLHIDLVSARFPQYSVIDNCYFVTGKDDGIDHRGARLQVSNCWIEDFAHEGIAASGGDTLRIFNTLVLNNDQGFEAGYTEREFDSGPHVFIDHSVAVGNNVGLRIGDDYDWDVWTYKDRMTVTNTVLYDNADNILNFVHILDGPLAGALDISHSLTNDPEYDGRNGNIAGIPRFDARFYLRPDSPGIAAGRHGVPLGRGDPTALEPVGVVINEVMYSAPDSLDTGDWIELYNLLDSDQDLSGWLLKDDDDDHVFTLPPGTLIPAGGYWVVSADTAAFSAHHPEVDNLVGEIPFGFGRNDQVRLYFPSGEVADSLAYREIAPWPVAAAQGFSLRLLAPRLDNARPENWGASHQLGGSPGRPNDDSVSAVLNAAAVAGSPRRFALAQNFPNPFNPFTRIEYTLPRAGRVSLSVFNLLGQKVVDLVDDEPQAAGRYGLALNAGPWSGGVYFYRLRLDDGTGLPPLQQTRKMVLAK